MRMFPTSKRGKLPRFFSCERFIATPNVAHNNAWPMAERVDHGGRNSNFY